MLHKQYCWKILDRAGRMVDPDPLGPDYYDEFVLGRYYDSRKDALEDLEAYCEKGFVTGGEFILLEFYEML